MIKLFILVLILKASIEFDISWIPNDPEGPLPMSNKYRNELESLCSSIK
jgi:hypothetical protein